MIVMKFGGTSVSSKENIERINSIIQQKDDKFIVVVSALSGTTDKLELIANEALSGNHPLLIEELKAKHLDFVHDVIRPINQTEVVIFVQGQFNTLESICESISTLGELSDKIRSRVMSFGEQLSAYILSKYLTQEGIDLHLLDSRKLIRANGNFLNARVNFEQTRNQIELLDKQSNYIAPGFIASNDGNETVLLGRGGSDYTASIFASATNASCLEIWSDVNGLQTANPKYVNDATSIEKLSYKEAFELAYFGAKVLYPPTIGPVMEKQIPIYLKNTSQPDQIGTLISAEPSETQNVQGVSSISDVSLVNISGVGLAQKKGTARKVFQAIEEAGVNVILISQSCSEQSICLGVLNSDSEAAKHALDNTFSLELESGLMNPAEVLNDHAIVAVVGDNMKSKTGLSGKVFSSLGENGINVFAIAQGASERNISIVVHKKDEGKAVNVIHEEFFQKATKKVHLFIAGIGNVGKSFIEVIQKQRNVLLTDHRIDLRIAGIANSRKMLFNEDGLTLEQIASLNNAGSEYKTFTDFLSEVQSKNLRNSVFIDNTASEEVSLAYKGFLEKSISVVACNKIACSSEYGLYRSLLETAKEHNCQFMYETSVGAALPVIKTIRDLILSGDKIHRIEAVISGSLNFIFNNYNGERPFAEVVMQAKTEGYTEPDPKIDLSGLDVMRKILILSREAGKVKELTDIEFKPFLPESCTNATSVDDFFKELAKNEGYFKAMYKHANDAGRKLKVVASMNNGALKVELKEIESDSAFYHLQGKDNIIALYTDRYETEPLIIKGAGAGALVTASGVFSDLMLVINK